MGSNDVERDVEDWWWAETWWLGCTGRNLQADIFDIYTLSKFTEKVLKFQKLTNPSQLHLPFTNPPMDRPLLHQIHIGARAGRPVRVRNIPFLSLLLLTFTYLTLTLNFKPIPTFPSSWIRVNSQLSEGLLSPTHCRNIWHAYSFPSSGFEGLEVAVVSRVSRIRKKTRRCRTVCESSVVLQSKFIASCHLELWSHKTSV